MGEEGRKLPVAGLGVFPPASAPAPVREERAITPGRGSCLARGLVCHSPAAVGQLPDTREVSKVAASWFRASVVRNPESGTTPFVILAAPARENVIHGERASSQRKTQVTVEPSMSAVPAVTSRSAYFSVKTNCLTDPLLLTASPLTLQGSKNDGTGAVRDMSYFVTNDLERQYRGFGAP